MYQYWFSNYNKYTTLIQNNNNRGNSGRDEDIRNCIFSAQFFCKLRTILKNKGINNEIIFKKSTEDIPGQTGKGGKYTTFNVSL